MNSVGFDAVAVHLTCVKNVGAFDTAACCVDKPLLLRVCFTQ